MITPDLLEAYKRTQYEVDAPGGAFVLKHTEHSAQVDALLGSTSSAWAFITAWNPKSQRLRDDENKRRQQSLVHEVTQRFRTVPGIGRGEDGWSEESVLVIGIERSEALALGRRFGQLAIVVGVKGQPAELVPCEGAQPSQVA